MVNETEYFYAVGWHMQIFEITKITGEIYEMKLQDCTAHSTRSVFDCWFSLNDLQRERNFCGKYNGIWNRNDMKPTKYAYTNNDTMIIELLCALYTQYTIYLDVYFSGFGISSAFTNEIECFANEFQSNQTITIYAF